VSALRRERPPKLLAVHPEGKPLPSEVETEEAVVAAAMHDKDTRDELLTVLEPEHFSSAACETLWGVLGRMSGAGKPVDLLSVLAEAREVLHELGDNRQRGSQYVSRVYDLGAAEQEHAVAWARDVRTLARRRRIIVAAQRVVGEGYEPQHAAETFAPWAVEQIAKAAGDDSDDKRKGPHATSKVAPLRLAELQEQWAGGREPRGLRIPFARLNGWTHGMRIGEVIFVAGDTGSGKSVLAEQIGVEVAGTMYGGHRIAVGYLSLEMPIRDVLDRALCMIANVEEDALQAGPKLHRPGCDRDGCRCDPDYDAIERIQSASAVLQAKPFFVDDADHDLVKVRSTVRRMQSMARAEGAHLGLVVIDHVHIMSMPDGERRDIVIGETVRAFKRLAIEEGLVMMVCAQLNREAGKRGEDIPPAISQIKDASAIEQIADKILLVHRPWAFMADKSSEKARACKDKASIVIGKNRKGSGLGAVPVRFGGAYKFEEVRE